MPRPAPLDPKARVNITIPTSLYAELKELADVNMRSFSAQVEMIVRRGLADLYEKSMENDERQLQALTRLP